MPLYVDFIGLNTLISSSFSTLTNTISSSHNTVLVSVPPAQRLAGINIHRNGPYGFNSWTQMRVSQNPLSRYYNKNSDFTFITQPGKTVNLQEPDEFTYRERYSQIYKFEEPFLTQKATPLIWNVGKTNIRRVGGNSVQNSLSTEKFSIMSSYYNNLIPFANDKVNSLLRYNTRNSAEYDFIKDMYLDGGLDDEDSPITYWEFLRYNELVYPRPENMFRKETRGRKSYVTFYYKNRIKRSVGFNKIIQSPPSPFSAKATNPENIVRHPHRAFVEFVPEVLSYSLANLYSDWPLDEGIDFLTKTPTVSLDKTVVDRNISNAGNLSLIFRLPTNGEGLLMNRHTQFSKDLHGRMDKVGAAGMLSSSTSTIEADYANYNQLLGDLAGLNLIYTPGPLYSRRTNMTLTSSVVDPNGMFIPETASSNHIMRFEGGALWEAGRITKNVPMLDSYDEFAQNIRLKNKNYTVVPEFIISNHVENILKSGSANYTEGNLFEITGAEAGNTKSSQENFYKTYSTSDFLKQFEVLYDDHKEFTNSQVLQLRCKAIKKFLPYQGFYPCQRTTDLAGRFYKSYKESMRYSIPDFPNGLDHVSGTLNFGKQFVLQPMFAPGVLFNSIKSGVAVDYPVITNVDTTSFVGVDNPKEYMISNNKFDHRVPFEALLEPERYLNGIEFVCNETHPSASVSGSTVFEGTGDTLYKMMANNFLAEVPEFFLQNRNFTTIVSKKQSDIGILEPGKVYGMRIRMRRSMNKTRNRVYHNNTTGAFYFPPQDIHGNGVRETFTMYSRPSAFGPPTRGTTDFDPDVAGTATFDFETNERARTYYYAGSPSLDSDDRSIGGVLQKDSRHGYNFPFTPPYYHGEAWCDITITGSAGGEKKTIEELIAAAEFKYTRFDSTFYHSTNCSIDNSATTKGPQAFPYINHNAVQISASVNVKGVSKSISGDSAGLALVVDTTEDDEKRWTIQTKFETPMLNFNNVSVANGNLTIPTATSNNASGSGATVPRGMWHQFGNIPNEDEGVFLEVGPIDFAWQEQLLGKSNEAADLKNHIMEDLSEFLGFSGVSTKLGRIAGAKKISEAVVAVPYVERGNVKKFFELNSDDVDEYLIPAAAGASTLGASVKNQIDAMKKYVFPPSFDFVQDRTIDPFAMYIFEFTHTLNQSDLSMIWQGLLPRLGHTHEEATTTITHPLLLKELLGGGLKGNNSTHRLPEELKWMVFKVKQRAHSSYFKKVVSRSPNVDQVEINMTPVVVDEFGDDRRAQYNWPYDFFSLVEMASLDATVEFSNRDYTDWTEGELPGINAVTSNEPDLSTSLVAEIFPESPVGAPMENAEEITDQYNELEVVKATALKDLIDGSEQKAQIEKDVVDMAAQQSAGELSNLRDMAQTGQMADVLGGLDFSSFDALMSQLGNSSLVLTDVLGIPADELMGANAGLLQSYVNNASQGALVAGFVDLRNSYNAYQQAVQQYGANSTQANVALAQVNAMVNTLENTSANFYGIN